jgi:hypothetical protein
MTSKRYEKTAKHRGFKDVVEARRCIRGGKEEAALRTNKGEVERKTIFIELKSV